MYLHRRKNLVLALFWVSACLFAQGAPLQIVSGVDKTVVKPGEVVELTVLVSGVPEPVTLSSPAVENGQYVGEPRLVLRSEAIDEENVRHVQRHIYRIKAGQSGRLLIGELTLTVAEQSYHCAAIAIVVSDTPRDPASKGDMWLSLEPSRYQVWAGEPVTVALVLYVWEKLRCNRAEASPIVVPGLTVSGITEMHDDFCRKQGRIYRRRTWRWLTIPEKIGDMELTMHCQVLLLVPKESSQFDKIFGEDPMFQAPFFRQNPPGEAFGASEQTVQLATTPVHLQVRLLSPGTAPAIGNNFRLHTLATPRQIYAEQSFHLLISLEGRGNLDSVALPPAYGEFLAKLPWRLHKQEILEARYDDVDGNFRKTFRLTVAVNAAGSYTIPAVRFCYFDPWAEQVEVSRQFPACEVEVIARVKK